MAQHHDAAHATPDDEYLNPTAVSGHEHTDANVWLIVQFAIWLAASAIVTHFLMWGLFTFFVKDRGATAKQAIEFPLAAQQERRLPAGPRLQAIPANEIFEFRQRENAELSEYGWVDRNAGTVHIPIDKAKELLLQRGLPSRPAPAASGDPAGTDAAALMPADSSSGRTLERRR
jgi:hypothetical protein